MTFHSWVLVNAFDFFPLDIINILMVFPFICHLPVLQVFCYKYKFNWTIIYNIRCAMYHIKPISLWKSMKK